MSQHAIYQKNGHVAEVTINRPEVLNALHPPADSELYEIWQDVARDPQVRVAILTGAGERAFSAGFDLKWARKHGISPTGRRLPFAGLAPRPEDEPAPELNKPIIAAINGLAIGGGMELALACDIIVAAEEAYFALSEARLGLVPLGGGVHWLPRQIPLKRALGLLFTGDRLSAREAYDLGLVNQVVPRAEVMDAARDWAARIARSGPLAVQAIKQAVYAGLGLPFELAQRRHYVLWDASLHSPEGEEGVRAFTEKRDPVWG